MKRSTIAAAGMLLLLLSQCDRVKKTTDQGQNKDQPVMTGLSGEALSMAHCGRCHMYVPPAALPKKIWQTYVLPSMGHRMGIYAGGHQPDSLFEPGIGGEMVRKAGVFPEKPTLAEAEWQAISAYYLANAPDGIEESTRSEPIAQGLKHFNYTRARFSQQPPLSIMVKILPDKPGFVYSDGKRDVSSLNFLNPDLTKDYNILLRTTPVHFIAEGDSAYVTTIGRKMYPHDAPDGAIQILYAQTPQGPLKSARLLVENLQRPVHVIREDMNNDGLKDFVVCEYGNLLGKLAWYENMGEHRYALRPLKMAPGAIMAKTDDVNDDGLTDLWVLMAQGDEGIFLFTNQGNGTFKEQRILRFPPLYGSQYFDLVDINSDGHRDIIYVCGDNADLSPVLKAFHGIYIYLNDGHFQFTQSTFLPLNGAYKALPGDYDLDGDVDLASISFFPDYAHSPEESFVYWENTGDLTFKPYSFAEAVDGRWIVMDAADMDGDDDVDLALGSFVGFDPQGDTTGLKMKWLRDSPSMVVLENTIK
jgi:hypothetical protein